MAAEAQDEGLATGSIGLIWSHEGEPVKVASDWLARGCCYVARYARGQQQYRAEKGSSF